MRDRKLFPGPGIELWIATIGIGAFLLGGLVDLDRGARRIGTVRLDELAAEMIERTIQGDESDHAITEAARLWAMDLEHALDAVAQRHGVVLLSVEAVAAGAPDYTDRVREAMLARQNIHAGLGAEEERRAEHSEPGP